MGPATLAFLVVFTGTLIVAMLQGERPFYGDSGVYWALANSFTHTGHFSLLNFESRLRGYALPLIYHLVQALGNGVGWSQSSVAKLFNVALFALIGAVLAPRLAETTWPQQHWNVPRRIALTLLLIVFWGGDLDYPLSDFPGLSLALLTLVAIAYPDRPSRMLTAGVSVGLAIDMRPAYLLLIPMLIFCVTSTWFGQRGVQHASFSHRMLCVGLLVLGFAVASLPQSLSAHRHYKTWSFIPGATAHLSDTELTYSLLLQRYDTFVAPPATALPMYYLDEAGARLLRRPITGTDEYLEIALEHPTVIAGLLMRHLVNGLDMRYSTVYVEHLDSGGQLWLRLAGFLVVFLALARVLWRSARASLGRAHWRYPVSLMACCFTALFSGIETRYMLPLWLLCCMLVLAPGWPNPIAPNEAGVRPLRTPATLAVSYPLFMVIVWYVVSGASAHVGN
ncbi:MAG TPA: hypothetical protein VIH71_01740 [Solirubrobacteraceae bacterium]